MLSNGLLKLIAGVKMVRSVVQGLKDGCSFFLKKKKRRKGAVGTGGCQAVRGRAVLSAILLTLHEGQLPANQLPSRTHELDRVLGNGEGRARDGAAIQSVWDCCVPR